MYQVRPVMQRCVPAIWAGVGLAALALFAGCTSKAPAPVARYQTLEPKQVPAFLKGTVLEETDLANIGYFNVSSYSLVGRLRATGSAEGVPTAVREYMLREMRKRGFGERSMGFEEYPPTTILNNNH